MKPIALLLLTLVLLSAACRPSEAAISTAIAQTEAAKPTATPTVTPSKTPAPTKTPTPTVTPTKTPTPTATPIPLPGGLIAFASNRLSVNGEWALMVMKPDGSEPVTLAANLGSRKRGVTSAWSPDGKRIVFEGRARLGDAEKYNDLYIVNVAGTDLRPLVFNLLTEHRNPTWSPDGKWVAFEASFLGHWEIKVVPLDGEKSFSLTDTLKDENAESFVYDNISPSWAPDSKSILYTSNRDRFPFCCPVQDLADYEIYRVKVANPKPEKVIKILANTDVFPVWSPKGSHFAFLSAAGLGDVLGYTAHIYIVPADDPDHWQSIAKFNTEALYPIHWSPDGEKLAFAVKDNDQTDIFVVDIADGDAINITNNSANDFAPTWSPDSQWIAFVSDRDDNFEIYMVRADGSRLVRLTENGAADVQPRWSPKP